jgi:hypothetical protein
MKEEKEIVHVQAQLKQIECATAESVQALFGLDRNPKWLEESYTPILIGGNVGFFLAYLLGIYTILHVATAYKSFFKKV